MINALLPVLARKEVDRLIAELQDAQFRLEAVPTTTLEFVHSLTFLDEIQMRVSATSLCVCVFVCESAYVCVCVHVCVCMCVCLCV